jgi:phosphoribosylformylglycinamidine cyclo-ligase
VGIDLVAMNVNDLIVQGAEPLLFLDYIGIHRLDPEVTTRIVKGVADGCVIAGCALLGGETAEMPDVYEKDDFDLAGFAVGVVELKRVVDGSRVELGDVILGLESSGVHSNGYTLVRAIVRERGLDLHRHYPEAQPAGARPLTLGQVLLTPTRIYAKPVVAVLRKYKVKQVVGGMAHITGGGLPGNVCRALPSNLDARIDTSAWTVPPVFDFLQSHGRVARDEMFRVFNMGIGYTMIVRPHFADSVREQLRKMGETAHVIGKVVRGSGEVVLR